jgi:hypothetical protein
MEPFPIALVMEDGLAVVAAIHDMIHGAGILDAQLPSHVTKLGKASRKSSEFTTRAGPAPVLRKNLTNNLIN